MTKVPDEWVEELRQRVDIVDVVSEYVPLRRAGRSFVGLCPFHNEKSPSFSVSPDRQLFHCFGCGAGGTVIRFVMDIEGLTFPEAVEKLAHRVDLQLPAGFHRQGETPPQDSRRQQMLDAHQLAAKYYNYILMNTAAGVQALTYLEGRGISRQTIMDFELGAAPDAPDALVRFLRKRGYSPSLIVESGLGVAMGAKVVDRFRNRVMVPIRDAEGRVISFGGRALTADAKPKYLNSPETELFHKSEVLFHFHAARKNVRKSRTAVLFEGYMDVISAWQAGVRHAVATMGTALTEEHARRLKRYADVLVIAYDGDAAGRKATKRALEIAANYGLTVRVALFPDEMDPDEFVRERGAAAFQRQVHNLAVTELEFLLEDLRSEAALDSMAGRTDFLRRALALLAERASPIEQDAELRRLSSEFQVSPEALRQELAMVAKRRPKRNRQSRMAAPEEVHRASVPVQEKDVSASQRILQALLVEPRAYEWLLSRGVDELATVEQTALLARLYHFRSVHQDGSPSAFLDSLEDPLLIRLASSLLMEDPPECSEAVIDDCLRIFKLHRAERKLREAMKELVQAQVDGCDNVTALKHTVEELQETCAALRQQLAGSMVTG
ncbi:DNA primase [Alicyclobacillus contaminans]|uniref:DNA primase n=1 Tax=Alicyclobacillus contaminans TaxID=392016 RepID=UPI0004170E7B|nr:DNA primase [Alicyclobacillus contaminans]GMA52166.1 DNA primase [Alicyclobacillus contaminans]